MMSLTNKQQKQLTQLAQKLKPVIWIGQHGLSDNVLAEIEVAINHHELIKIKLRVGDRELRDKIIEDICKQTGAEIVQRVGNVASLYRHNVDNPVIKLPG